MPFDFSAISTVKQVQKIVVTAKDADGNDFKFPQEYKVVNTALPEAKLSLAEGAISKIACTDLNGDHDINVDDQNIEMQNATKTFMYSSYSATNNVASPEWADFEASTSYEPAVEARSENGFDYLVVDFDGTHTDTAGDGGLTLTNGKFSAYMLMPAGVYGEITFKIYTDNGVYTKAVTNRYGFVDGLTDAEKADYEGIDLGEGEIFLRPNTRMAVSDIENVLPSGNAKEYLKVTAADYEAGNLITKTADLINFINGIKNIGSYDANVLTQAQVGDPTSNPADDAALPAHTVVINKAVMDAIVTKETLLGGDIQLVFKGAKMQIKGGTNNDVLDIHDLTFNDDAEIIEGYVKASADVVVPESKSLDIKNSSSLQLAMDNNEFASLYTVNVERGSELKVTSNNSIHTIKNEGALAIGSSDNKRGSITTANLTNKGTLRNFNQLNVTDNLTNEADSKLITAGELTIKTKAVNNGTLENSKDIKVLGEMTNNSTISNSKGGFIFVTSTSTGKFNNAATGVITNAGRIYTNTGENTIENLGIIEAKEGSTTYITTNSALDEKQNGTNGEGQVMGTIKIEKRNTDISVTTPRNQGYKEYTVAAEDLTDGVLSAVAKDKFNKIVLSTEAELSAEVAEYINFIVTSTNITLPKGDKVQELTFTGNAEIYAETPASKSERVVVSQLKVEENLFVKLPTENALYVFGIKSFENTATSAKIINLGEILVGGNLYTSLSKDEAVATSDHDALFTAGHGVSTAWHWGEQW